MQSVGAHLFSKGENMSNETEKDHISSQLNKMVEGISSKVQPPNTRLFYTLLQNTQVNATNAENLKAIMDGEEDPIIKKAIQDVLTNPKDIKAIAKTLSVPVVGTLKDMRQASNKGDFFNLFLLGGNLAEMVAMSFTDGLNSPKAVTAIFSFCFAIKELPAEDSHPLLAAIFTAGELAMQNDVKKLIHDTAETALKEMTGEKKKGDSNVS